jgi:hypothetical protein
MHGVRREPLLEAAAHDLTTGTDVAPMAPAPAAVQVRGCRMPISQRFNMPLLGVMVLGIAFTLSSALSRPWKPTPIQIARDYAQINHRKSNTEFVNIRWWASPTVMSGMPIAKVLEKLRRAFCRSFSYWSRRNDLR